MKILAPILLVACGLSAAHAAEPRFDPLTASELAKVVALLVESGRTNGETRLARVGLAPIHKSASPKRLAEVIALLDGQTTRVIVDLKQETLHFAQIEDGEAPITSNDWSRANEELRRSGAWKDALAERGIDDPDSVFCEGLSAGYFPGTPAAKQRVLRLPCYEISGASTNIYGRPVEGLIATVDPTSGTLIELLDEGARPLPAMAAQLPVARGRASPPDPRILKDGHRIRFGAWSLHAGLDDRFGLIVSDVRFLDGGQDREILHNGHVSEVFVPYMDPTESWAFRTYLDAGEFGLGTLASPLVPGVDCPAGAVFMGSHHLTPTARIIEKPRTICAFAQGLPGPLWRHHEALNGLTAGAAGEALVVRSISSVAHYDYVFDWVFGPTGEIEIRIGATGIDAVKALAGDANVAEGNRVTPDLIAVFHDHFFSLRLDVEIDGPANTLVRQSVKVRTDRQNALGRSYWTLESTEITQEGPLVATQEGLWRVQSDVGQRLYDEGTGYQIIPQGTVSVLDPEDYPQRRAAYSAAPLWITSYDPFEKAAAGDFPNQHLGGAGLPAYARDEITPGEDIVIWPTIGFRHVTRPEDWPALSTVWKSMQLRPYGFFRSNPAID